MKQKAAIGDRAELEGHLFYHLYPFNIKEYTSMDLYTLKNTKNEMKISGVDVEFLNSILKDYNICFGIKNEFSVGLFDSAKKVILDEQIKERFGINALAFDGDLDNCYKGLILFCLLSRQNYLDNKNLLDLKLKSNEKAIEIKSLSTNLKYFNIKPKSEIYKLEKQIFEYRIGRKLPDNLKKLPLNINSFIKSPDRNDDQEIDLLSSSEDIILKYVYRKRIEQFGYLNNAADSLKLSHSTFRGRIKSKFPELLPQKKRNNPK